MFNKLLFFVLFLFPLSSMAQTGPAGVGSSSTTILWLSSDDVAQSNNTNVSTWADRSGNGNDITQPDANYQPLFITNVLNSYPAIRFSTDDRLRRTSFSDFPSSAITVFLVDKTSDNNDGPFSYASSASNNDFLIFNSANYRIYRGGSQVTSGVSANNSAFHIVNVNWQSSDGAVNLWKDGAVAYSSTLASGADITAGGCLSIAGEQDAIDGSYDPAQFFDGDISEIIVFNTYLNKAQNIIVANYLAAKYGLTISNDLYAYQAHHSYDLAGIGRADAADIHTAAMSGGILQIENPSSMTTDGDYLLFAHDNAAIDSWTTTEAPSVGNIERIAREWRFDETGNVGTIDFRISTAKLPALNSGYTKYAVMVDADGDFTNGAAVYELGASGSDYLRSGINIADGDYVSIAAVKPTIQFTSATGTADESVSPSIEVSSNYNPISTISVDYATSDGSATAGSDYTATSGTLSIAAGTISNTITVSVTDDATSESDETFDVNLSNPSSGINIGTNSTYTYTIEDNDNTRKVNFDNASGSGSESVATVTVGLSLSVSDASNTTSVDYKVVGGTATGGGVDYTLSSGTVTFAAGTTTGSFDISINNDALDEDDETIIVEIYNPVNCNIGTTADYTYTIIDDDATPSIQFSSTSASGLESVASKVVQVELSAASSKDVSVDIGTSGTATKGVDYSLSASTLTITAGNTSTSLTISIVNDNIVENNETVDLALENPVNATIGTNNSYTYTILNDDSYGFDGPGGVGKSDNLKLWVKAEDIPGSADGDRISSWPDKSGNSNDLSQSNSSYQPAYYANVVNSFPVARFDQDLNRLIHNSFSDFPTDGITTLFVNKNASESGDGVISYASSTSDNDYLLYSSNNVTVYRASNNNSSGVNIATDAWDIFMNSWDNSDDKSNTYLNGSLKKTATISGGKITQNGCLALSAEQDAVNGGYVSSQTHYGDFAELIIYDQVLPSVQRNIVNSYLAAKYNISITGDKYSGDDASKGNYDFEVIGIATESDAMHDEAHGSGGLWIKQSANFDNGDYLLIGHNAVQNQIYRASQDAGLSSASIEQRWARDWYFDVTDAAAVMAVNLTFDFSEGGMTNPNSPAGSAGNYKLIYRNGTSGNWSIITSASSVSSEQVVFEGVSLSNGDGYYALGTIDSTASPLPIELLSFTAQRLGEGVLLEWSTATETNNDFFEVQRSRNGIDWDNIKKIRGQGNSNQTYKYKMLDKNPLRAKSYYRLKQYDFDGKFSYSPIVSVYFNNEVEIVAYPNPVKSVLNISSTDPIISIQLINQMGDVSTIPIHKYSKSYQVSMLGLSSGIYFVKIQTVNSAKTIKLINY